MGEFDYSDFLGEYRVEAHENLDALEKGLLALESIAPDNYAEAINALFRPAHTIKGSSRMMGFEGVAQVAHALEDVLGGLREEKLAASPELVDELLQTVDHLRKMVQQPPEFVEGVDKFINRMQKLLEPKSPEHKANGPPQPDPEPVNALEREPKEPAANSPSEETVRIPVNRLDKLLQLTGELRLSGQRAQALNGNNYELVTKLQSYLKAIANGDENGLKALRQTAKGLAEQVQAWRVEQMDSTHMLVSASTQIEQEVITLRLLPISTVFASLPRLVRDLSREHEKPIDLIMEGETTELDRRILQGLGEPLMHLIRNAVDHGLEPSADRVEAGKPANGQIRVRAYQQGKQVRVELADDGRGMNAQALRESAVRKKLITAEEAATLDDEVALQLIFLPGFSTSKYITTTSGRGVGMEVIKETIAQLGGSVELWTQPGQGTCFTLVLPLTLTLAHVLLVESGARIYALPAGAVQRIIRLTPDMVQLGGGRENVILDGRPIPLFHLGQVLGFPVKKEKSFPALIVSISEQRVAFVVGRVLDECEVVLKPLGHLLSRAELVSGATVLPDGHVALVLDPAACLRASRRGLQHGDIKMQSDLEMEPLTRQRILVVEDTYTTRELIRSILVASGYDVETAVDGSEGWQKLQKNAFDLVITDIEMPYMNGFELTKAIRAEEHFANLPVIIVTGLEKESEKRQGLTVGAQAYLVKSAFNQMELLETVERLVV